MNLFKNKVLYSPVTARAGEGTFQVIAQRQKTNKYKKTKMA